jgi:hypothetical protein
MQKRSARARERESAYLKKNRSIDKESDSYHRRFMTHFLLLILILIDAWSFFWAAIYEYAFWHHVKSFEACFMSSLWAWFVLAITLPLTVYLWLRTSEK